MDPRPLERTLTELDHARLSRHARAEAAARQPLHDLLESAQLVPSRAVAPDVVTMYTQVRLRFADGRSEKLVPCYPQDAEPAAGFVSALSPLGAGLLGLRAGDTARWRTPDGQEASAEIVEVLFQPEASGDYLM